MSGSGVQPPKDTSRPGSPPHRPTEGQESASQHRERIDSQLCMWQKHYPPGSDFTGDGHEAPPAWVYDFWRQCEFTDEQLPWVEPTLGDRTLHMEWATLDGEFINRMDSCHYEQDENADHPQLWSYHLDFGDEDAPTERPVAYFWRCNTIGIPLRHWEPQEGGRYTTGGIPGEYVDHPQPEWAILDGGLLSNPTVEQIHRFVDKGEMPTATDDQQWEVE